jgi:hypothetical protein
MIDDTIMILQRSSHVDYDSNYQSQFTIGVMATLRLVANDLPLLPSDPFYYGTSDPVVLTVNIINNGTIISDCGHYCGIELPVLLTGDNNTLSLDFSWTTQRLTFSCCVICKQVVV